MILLQAASMVAPAHGGIVFDGTINLGNILTMVFGAIVWAVTLAIAWTKLGGRIQMVEFRLNLVDKAVEDIAEVLKKFNTNETEIALLKQQVAAHGEMIATLENIVEGLRRGVGFINDNGARGINREY